MPNGETLHPVRQVVMQLSSILEQWNNGKIYIPSQQRTPEAWKRTSKKRKLILTVLEGYCLNPFLLHKKGTRLGLRDGHNRAFVMRSYKNSEFRLSLNTPPIGGFEVAGCTFDMLPEELKTQFSEYEIAVNIMDASWTDEEVLEQLRRMSYHVIHNGAETRRSFPGNMPGIVEKLAAHPVFEDIPEAAAIDRNGDEGLCATLLHLIFAGKIVGIVRDAVDTMYMDQRLQSADCPEVKAFHRVLDFILEAFKGQDQVFKKAAFINVGWLVYDFMYLQGLDLEKYPQEFEQAYSDFESDRKGDDQDLEGNEEQDEDTADFDLFSNTLNNDSAKSIQIRCGILSAYLKKRLPKMQ